jgi:hypothetical protein
METNRTRNMFISAVVFALLIVGGYYVINNVNLGGNAPIVEAEEVCIEYGEIFEEVCANSETNAVLVSLGNAPDPAVEVTVTYEGLSVTGMSNIILERFATEESVVPVTVDETDAETEVVELDFSSFPIRVEPYRTTFDHEQTTHILGTEFMLGDPGVYGVLDLEDVTNGSAVLMDSDTKYVLTTNVESINLPEDGYLFASGASFDLDVCGLYTVSFPDFSEYDHEWQIVLRGRNWIDGVDGNCQVTFSNYNDGFVQVQRFPVERGANGFFSAEYVQQQVDHAVGISGNRGFETNVVSLFTLDINDGAWALNWFENDEWDLFGTNINYGNR